MISYDHPLRPMLVDQREVLIAQARLYRRWRGAQGLPADCVELFAELEQSAAQAIRAIEQRVAIARPWTGG